MSRTLHVCTNLRASDSPSRVYAELAVQMPANVLIALGPGIARELRQELHSWKRVAEWAADLAIRLDRPLLLNFPDRDGSSRSIVLAPNWSKERLAGWIAGRHAEIEAAFGPIGKVA